MLGLSLSAHGVNFSIRSLETPGQVLNEIARLPLRVIVTQLPGFPDITREPNGGDDPTEDGLTRATFALCP